LRADFDLKLRRDRKTFSDKIVARRMAMPRLCFNHEK
jgi:hypothetical protein